MQMARNDYKGADDHGLRLKGSPHFLSTVIPRFTRFSITRFSITRFFDPIQKNLHKDL